MGKITKCSCIYAQEGKQVGLCLRCAELQIESQIKGEKKVLKLLRKLYKKRGEPVWFLSVMDLEVLEKGDEDNG